jgi:exosortase C (VPDSG-CTERM-specific)
MIDSTPSPSTKHGSLRPFYAATLILVGLFGLPLYDLIRFAAKSDLFSHVILVPFVSAYLVWMKRASLPSPGITPDRRWAIAPLMAGSLLVGLRFMLNPVAVDALAYTTLAFVLLFLGLCAWHLNTALLKQIAFPLGFLFFMVPFPHALTEWIEATLQTHSATAAYLFFKLAGTTMFRHETYIELPGIKLLVAPECSGINSSLTLFIVSLLAGHLFLRSSLNRLALALIVIPLAIFRNGFRVFVIGELCVRIGPEMIHSYIHRQGGPIFFALSLIPFILILWGLVKWESRRAPASSS